MKQLRELRLKRGMTQAQVAELCGCTAAHISLIENGKVNITLDMLKRIAKALDAESEIILRAKEEAEELHEMWCKRYGK